MIDLLTMCREQSLQEVLEISFAVLKGHYLAAFGQQLQTASSWQTAEAALFGIRSGAPTSTPCLASTDIDHDSKLCHHVYLSCLL